MDDNENFYGSGSDDLRSGYRRSAVLDPPPDSLRIPILDEEPLLSDLLHLYRERFELLPRLKGEERKTYIKEWNHQFRCTANKIIKKFGYRGKTAINDYVRRILTRAYAISCQDELKEDPQLRQRFEHAKEELEQIPIQLTVRGREQLLQRDRKISNMYKQMTGQEIANKLGIGKNTVFRSLARSGVTTRKGGRRPGFRYQTGQ